MHARAVARACACRNCAPSVKRTRFRHAPSLSFSKSFIRQVGWSMDRICLDDDDDDDDDDDSRLDAVGVMKID